MSMHENSSLYWNHSKNPELDTDPPLHECNYCHDVFQENNMSSNLIYCIDCNKEKQQDAFDEKIEEAIDFLENNGYKIIRPKTEDNE